MKDGFIRVAAVTPDIKVADCDHNADEIIRLAKEASENGASIIVFPELCVTGSTCGDLFKQKILLDGAMYALKKITEKTVDCNALIIVGVPIKSGDTVYNCAAALNKGDILGFVPKINIPENETRWFSAWTGDTHSVNVCGRYKTLAAMSIGCDELPELEIGIEIGEDASAPAPVSTTLSAEGATLICNLSAAPAIIGRDTAALGMAKAQSARLKCGYISVNAGMGESTQDYVFNGYNFICENGRLLAESKKFTTGITYAEIDFQYIKSERRKAKISRPAAEIDLVYESFSVEPKDIDLTRKYPLNPFVPEDKAELASRCEEILTMQATGLATRLRHIGCKTAVVGLSGGLDSTLALIVTVHAFDMLGLDRKGIVAVTMPCFGTTSRTKNNAYYLAEAYKTTLKEINIAAAVRQHFADIGQDEANLDVTFENAQARERTQVLMDIANMTNGLVIGTGDLSELALGWATYNGDHMSMYGVNGSVPKTLVRHLVAYESNNTTDSKLSEVLRDILDTPVSPELLPPKEGEISQKTEDIVGPYELHDFFLYYMVRCGFAPSKILRIAVKTFDGIYDYDTIKKWLTIFVRRFFTQQFKRSCLPDGPKVGTVSLSPRGDWNMPSDACVRLWLEDLE